MIENYCNICKTVFNGDEAKDRVEHYECGQFDTVWIRKPIGTRLVWDWKEIGATLAVSALVIGVLVWTWFQV